MPTADFELSRDPFGHLVLTDAESRRYVGIEPFRAFPLSEPCRSIALCDAEGREVLWIDDLNALPPATQELVEAELGQREFVPIIEQIVSVSADSAPCDWEVKTDRGPTRFSLKNDEDVRRLGPNRILITDAHSLRYQVPDARTLDAASRRMLERFL
jgi:hypothetical protein